MDIVEATNFLLMYSWDGSGLLKEMCLYLIFASIIQSFWW
jgi:hypothetical protein